MRSSNRKSVRALGVAAAVVLAVAGSAGVAGCGKVEVSNAEGAQPVVVEAAGPDGISKVTLSQQAADRIGLQTATVHEEVVNGLSRKVIPYASVLYDPEGQTYAYGNPEPLVFSRVKLVVDTVEGDVAVLTDGPPDGTRVVTLGATELFGAEFEVGGE